MARRPIEFKGMHKGLSYFEPEKMRISNLYCCGLKELHGIQNTAYFFNEETGEHHREPVPMSWTIREIKRLMGEYGVPHRPYWVFTDNSERTQPGEKLAQYLEEHGFGKVIRSGYLHNYNSGAKVQTYTWCLDLEQGNAFKKHKFEPKIETAAA